MCPIKSGVKTHCSSNRALQTSPPGPVPQPTDCGRVCILNLHCLRWLSQDFLVWKGSWELLQLLFEGYELSCGRGREPTCWSRPARQRSPRSATCPSPAVSAAPYDHKDTRGRADRTQFATFQACSAVPGCLSPTHLVPADGRSPCSPPRLSGTQSLMPLRVQAPLGTVPGRMSPTHGTGFWGSRKEGARLAWSGSEQAGAILPRCALNALRHKFPRSSEARY